MKKFTIVILLCLTSICLFGQQKDLPPQLVKMDSLLNSLNNYRSSDLIESGIRLVRQYKDTILVYGDSISPQYAHALNREGEFLGMQGQLTQSLPLLNESISILTTLKKTESQLYILVSSNLAQYSMWLGDFTEAEKWFRITLSSQEKKSGKENPKYSSSLMLFGQLKALTSDYEESEILLNEAMAISVRVNGKDSHQTAQAHSGLAILYAESGHPEKAIPHFIENLRISEIRYGKDDERYAVSLMQVGICYQHMDLPGRSEEYLLKSLSYYQSTGVNNLPELAKGNYISLLYNICNTYEAMGKYDKALPIILEVDSFCNSSSGNLLVCRGVGLSKGNILSSLGYKSEAENAFQQYKQYILDETGRTDNPQYGKALTNLAILYLEEGNFEKARPMLEESCSIFDNLYGKANEIYLTTLGKLGMIYLFTGDSLQALSIFQSIEKTARDSFPTESTAYYSLMNSISKFYHYDKDGAAIKYYQELMPLLPKQFLEATQLFSEREFLASDHKYIRDIHRFQSYMLDYPAEKSLYELGYDVSIHTKSIYLDNRLKLQAQIQQADSSTQALYKDWKKMQLQLYDSYSENNPNSLAEIKLENSIDSMEVHLFKNLPGLSDLKSKISWKNIESALSPGEAAVEISRVPYLNPEPTNLVYYSASIILPGNSTPVFIPLCEEAELAALLYYTSDNKKARVNSLYTYAFNGQALFNLIWKPIQTHLDGIKKIYISPDGLFHRMQLAAIPVNERQIVDDLYDITILSSTRELANPNRALDIHHLSEPKAAVFGGLIYDETPTNSQTNNLVHSMQ
nr:tetratricopeptide repeat protein [Bacteroidota bacterium]